MKTLFIAIALVLAGFSLEACSSSKSGSVPISTVVISDMKFAPETINVPVGTTVTWRNIDSKTHTATANDGSFDTGDMGTAEAKSVTFSKAGTFKYHCKYHTILGVGMTGTVIVE
ncbi:MAG: cupredoxin family copper-binding protein [Bacteroidota bacterium]|nr:cupredoxin family copper-binding protein [Bacteroidota bacterium]